MPSKDHATPAPGPLEAALTPSIADAARVCTLLVRMGQDVADIAQMVGNGKLAYAALRSVDAWWAALDAWDALYSVIEAEREALR